MKQTLDVGDGPTRRRPRHQAQRLGSPTSEQRPLQRGQWIGLGVAALAAVGLTAGLVFLILTLTRPSEPRPLPSTATGPQTSTSPTPLPISQIFATPTPPTAVIATLPPRVERVQIANTDGEGANLRREPSVNAERIRVLPEGTVVEIVGPDRPAEGRVWRNVRDADGETGWITNNFLVAEGTVPPPSSSASQSPPTTVVPAAASTSAPQASKPSRGQIGNTGGQGANVRSEPGAGGRVLKTLAEGTNVEVLGPQREVDGRIWRQVRDSAGVTGWVTAGAVVAPGTVATPPPPGSRAAPTSAPGPTAAPGATAAPSQPGPTTQATPTSRPSGTLAPLPAPPSLFNPGTPSSNPTAPPGSAQRTPTPRP
jgi:SH3-like domain-containing protein